TAGPRLARSRTNVPAPTATPSASRAPERTTASGPTRQSAPSRRGGGASRGAREVAPSRGGLPRIAPSPIATRSPTTVPSCTTTRSASRTSAPSSTPAPTTARSSGAGTGLPGAGVERALQPLEHSHHAQTALPVRGRRAPVAHALDEVLALHAQRLHVVDPGAPGVARAGDVLAVAGGALVEALVVDRHLALQLHVVERGHLASADDGEPPLLVRVQPREVQVGDRKSVV